MASLASTVVPAPSLTRSLPALLVLALAMVVGFTVMGSFGTVQEGAKADLQLSDYGLGLVQGVGTAIPLVLFSMPIGLLVDRVNRVRLLVVMAAIWTVGTLMTALADGLASLFVARMLVGIGTTGGLTAVLSIGADLCCPGERGRAMLIISVGKALGAALAFALAGALYGYFLDRGPVGPAPWRSIHLVLGAVSTAVAAALWLMREPERHERTEAPRAAPRALARQMWRRRRILVPLFVGQASVVMADTAAAIWAAPVLSRDFHLRPDQFAGWVGVLLFATGMAGTVIGGIVADAGQQSGRRGGILYGAVVAAAIGVPAALFPLGTSVAAFATGLGALVLAGNVTGVVTSVALTVLIPNELRGLCIGAFIAVAGLVGYGIAPVMVAGVSDLLGGEAHLASGLAIVGVGVGLISVAAFGIAIRTAPVRAD